MIARGTFALLLLACTSIAQAEVYKWVDSSGKPHFSDHAPTASQGGNARVELLHGIPKSIQDRILQSTRPGISIDSISGDGRQCLITGTSITHVLTVAFVDRLLHDGIGDLLIPLPPDNTTTHGAETFQLHMLLSEEWMTWAKSQQ